MLTLCVTLQNIIDVHSGFVSTDTVVMYRVDRWTRLRHTWYAVRAPKKSENRTIICLPWTPERFRKKKKLSVSSFSKMFAFFLAVRLNRLR